MGKWLKKRSRATANAGRPPAAESGERPPFEQRLRALIEVGNELARQPTLEDLCRRAVELGRARLGFDRLSIWFCGDRPDVLHGTFGIDERGGLRDERGRTVELHDAARLYETLERATTRWVFREGPLYDDQRRRVGNGQWMCAALRDAEKIVGYMFCDNLLAQRPLTEQDGELLVLFAVTVGHLYSLKRAEEAVRRAEREQRATLDAVADAVHVVDRDLRILWINARFRQWMKMLGIPGELVGRTVFEVFPFLPEKVRDEYRRVFETGEPVVTEETNRVGDREIITDTRKMPIIENGRVVRVATSVRDITESKRAEEALRESRLQFLQAQKMEALGRLAGGVAHDFNNLLTTILGYGRLVLDRLRPSDPLYADMEEIVRAGERAVDLTSQLLAFGRSRVGLARPVNLNTVVVEMDRLLRRTLGEDVELVTMLGENLGGVLADPSQLQQVIMNLAINARDAMPHGGKLVLQTAVVELDEPFCATRPGLRPGPHVRLVVKDNGVGMSAEVKQHLFEPFYTTKPRGKGSGLGLATVYGIVKQSNGWIEIESEEGKGTTVMIYFPRHEEMAAEVLPAESRLDVPRGTETILVVEDEESVRRFTVKILESLGYRVLEAANGAEALLLFEMEKGAIDLVLTDVVMPLMSGRELVRRLRATGHKFKVLFTTGFSDEILEEDGSGPAWALLQKPYTRESLGRRVRQVLDSSGSA